MKSVIKDALKTKEAEGLFAATFVILLLLIIPSLPLGKYAGGIAMVMTAILGLTIYFILFWERFHNRRLVKLTLISFALGAAFALWLARGH